MRQKSTSIGESDRHDGRAEENMNCCPSRTRLDSLRGRVLRAVRGMVMVFAMLVGVGFFAVAGWAQSGAAQAGQGRGGNAAAGAQMAPKRAGRRAVKTALRAAAAMAARSKCCTCRGT